MPALPLLLWLLLHPVDPEPISAPVHSRSVSLVDYAFAGLPNASVAEAAHTEEWIARGASALLAPAPLIVNVPAMLPDASTTRRVKLEPGVYVVLCFVPAGRDASGAIVNHVHLGMRQTFVVAS